MVTMSFSELVEINPRVELKKGQEYPFIEMGVVEPARRYVQADQKRTFKSGGARFSPGDTLFARITPCLENGKIAQYKSTTRKPGFGSTEFIVFRARHEVSDPGFVYYLVKSDLVRMPAERSMSGASGRQRAKIESIIDLNVPAPPLPIQRKIASILSAYDDLIEINLRRIKILEEMAQNLYREWFVKFRFPGHEKVRFVDSPLGKIPEGWEIVKVVNVLTKIKRPVKIKRKDYSVHGQFPVIDQGKNFIGGYTNQKESIIFNELPVIVFGDHTRAIKYVDFPFACGADGTQLLKSKTSKMPISLFYYTLSSIDLSSYSYARHFKFLKDESILLPEEKISRKFDMLTTPIRNLIGTFNQQNIILRQTRDLLLPKLISGELDVSELDINVPEETEA